MHNEQNIVKLWADFNTNSKNGLLLICNGTLEEIKKQQIELKDGMRLLIWDEDFDDNNIQDNILVEAIAKFNPELNCWEAVFDWKEITHESDLKK
jgi:hypothetical protein